MTRSLFYWGQRVATLIASAVVIGVLGEAWHVLQEPCGGLHPPSPLAVCTHPPGFWLLDFVILASGALIIVGVLWVSTEILARFSSRRRPWKKPLPSGFHEVGLGVLVVAMATLGVLGAPFIYRILWPSGPPMGGPSLDLQNVGGGTLLLVSAALGPVLTAYIILLALGYLGCRRTHPVATGCGILIGTFLGILTFGPSLLRELWEEVFGRMYPQYTAELLLAPLFGYAFFIVSSRWVHPRDLSRIEVGLHFAVASLLYLSATLLFSDFMLPLLGLYASLIATFTVGVFARRALQDRRNDGPL